MQNTGAEKQNLQNNGYNAESYEDSMSTSDTQM